jgi:hypothetical protein
VTAAIARVLFALALAGAAAWAVHGLWAVVHGLAVTP